jgi:hypothetical protein
VSIQTDIWDKNGCFMLSVCGIDIAERHRVHNMRPTTVICGSAVAIMNMHPLILSVLLVLSVLRSAS